MCGTPGALSAPGVTLSCRRAPLVRLRGMAISESEIERQASPPYLLGRRAT